MTSPESPPPLHPLPPMALARGRVHEMTGPARLTLAALAAGVAQAEGPVLWLRPAWRSERLCAQGLAALMPDPGALVIVDCPKAVDVLWGMEEVLRAGCVALAVAELAEPPDLKQVRRMHLAAADGLARNRRAGGLAPLGLIAACEVADSRITGVESRWALHPLPPDDTPPPPPMPGLRARGRWRLERLMMRGLPPQEWRLSGGSGAVVRQDRGQALVGANPT